MPVAPEVLVVALAVTFVAAAVQGTIGIGLGMLSVPVLTLVDPTLTPVPQLIVTLPLTLAMTRSERHAIDWRGVGRLSLARIPGIGAGIWLLSVADDRTLNGVIGGIVLFAVAVIASGVTIHRNRTSEIIAGMTSGATGTVSSIGGPPLALLYRRDTGPAMRSNISAIFVVGLAMMLTARALSGNVSTSDLMVALWLAPTVWAGYMASRAIRARMEGPLLRAGILAVSALAGLGLVIESIAA